MKREHIPQVHCSTPDQGEATRSANPCLEAALAYAGFGWRVIPLHSPLPGGGCTCGRANCAAAGKHPRIAAWQRDASTDPERIAAWWKQWPEANVGLLMGQASGVIAIDVDPRNGGEETLAELTAKYGALPNTVTALTGGGGIHYLFAAPGRPVKKNNNGAALGPGLDLQGERSLIVAAPSLHASGAHYQWADGCAPWERELAPLPAWVLALVDANQQQRRDGKAPRGSATLPDKILEGARDETLFLWACYLRGQKGLEEDEILARLREENDKRCEPPLDDEDLRKIAHSAAGYEAGQGRGGGRRSVASMLVEIAEATEGIEFWHTPERERFISVPVGEHTEHWPLDSTDFREWLQDRLYREKDGRTASRSAVDEALGVFGRWAKAGPEHPIYTRVGEAEGAIYLDLADAEWRAVKITPAGWEVVSNPPVRFRRPPGQLALPTPERDGNLADLRRFINVSDAEWPLLAAWLLFAFRPDADEHGDFPVLILGGQPGSAKSTTSSVLKRLIDPHKAALRAEIRDNHDLAVAAQHSWVVTLDNISSIPVWLSNALCRLATGNDYSTRALYTNSDEVVFSAKRPQIVNGIGDFATRSDLLERALLINCPRIPKEARQTKTKFWKAFDAAWPRLLGAALDCVCGALAKLPEVELDGVPRMADFAVFATAAARAGAFGEKEFWDAYGASQADAHAIALEASPVGQAVLALLEEAGGKWEGTATGLLNELAGYADPATRQLRAWPKKADALSKALEGLAEDLREHGVTVTRVRTKQARVITLTRSVPPGDARVTPGDAKVTPGDANGDAKEAPKSQARRGFAPGVTPGDAKKPHFSVENTRKREEEGAGEGEEREKKECGKSASPGVIASPTPTKATPDDASDGEAAASPGDADVIDYCACGREAVRYSPTGTPFCSECFEAASARPTADGPALAGESGPDAFRSWRDEMNALAEACRAAANGKAGPDDAASDAESPDDGTCSCGKPGKTLCSECAELEEMFIPAPPGWEEEWRARWEQAKVDDDDTTGYPSNQDAAKSARQDDDEDLF